MEANKINVGNFDQRIVIEKKVENNTGTRGHKSYKWMVFVNAWAQVDEGVSSESQEVYQLGSEQTINITMHWHDGVNNKMRVSHEGDYYYINGVGKVGRKQFLIVNATAKDV